MRWSISTKIFVGFAAVIFAFGAVGLYGIYRMHQLRSSVRLVRVEVLPLASTLDSIISDLKTYEEELARTSDRDLVRLRGYFPSFRTYVRLEEIATRLDRLASTAPLSKDDNERVKLQSDRLKNVRDGQEFWSRIQGRSDSKNHPVVREAKKATSNEHVYEIQSRAYISALQRQEFNRARRMQEELAGMIRHVRTELVGIRKEVHRFGVRVDRAAERSESRALLVISVATGIALVIALMVMTLVAYTLRPLRRLREGVRRVAAGDFAEVEVNTGDELGELAGEFNRMSTSLAERDQLLIKQRYELIRSERLATIGKMSSQIAHEIRNPLSSIGLNTELLEEELSEEGEGSRLTESRPLLTAIRAEVDRLADVTEQYLRFARVPKPELSSEDVNALVRDLTAFMEQEFVSNSVELIVDLSSKLPRVAADRDQLRQAIINLLRNAMEAIGNDGVVNVSTRLEGAAVAIDIQDSGPGIEKDSIENIFDPFFTTKTDGTGLGLPLVLQVVREHGGDVTCRSSPEQGTVFSIVLPCESLGSKDIADRSAS